MRRYPQIGEIWVYEASSFGEKWYYLILGPAETGEYMPINHVYMNAYRLDLKQVYYAGFDMYDTRGYALEASQFNQGENSET